MERTFTLPSSAPPQWKRGGGILKRAEGLSTRLSVLGVISVILLSTMTIYSLYIFDRSVQPSPPPSFQSGDSRFKHVQDRHCTCVYYQDWHRSRKPKPAASGGILPAVNRSLSPTTTTGSHVQDVSPRSTLSINSGLVIAVSNDDPNFTQHPNASTTGAGGQPATGGGQSTGLSFDEEAKLVYGVVLSLRNMIKKLSGK